MNYIMKKVVRLTENDLNRIVKKNVNNILRKAIMPNDEKKKKKGIDKQNYLLNSEVNQILRKIYNAALDLKSEYLMDLCIEAQTALLKEKGFI